MSLKAESPTVSLDSIEREEEKQAYRVYEATVLIRCARIALDPNSPTRDSVGEAMCLTEIALRVLGDMEKANESIVLDLIRRRHQPGAPTEGARS